jgi:hypothetical protein
MYHETSHSRHLWGRFQELKLEAMQHDGLRAALTPRMGPGQSPGEGQAPGDSRKVLKALNCVSQKVIFTTFFVIIDGIKLIKWLKILFFFRLKYFDISKNAKSVPSGFFLFLFSIVYLSFCNSRGCTSLNPPLICMYYVTSQDRKNGVYHETNQPWNPSAHVSWKKSTV